jgi:hypothetical protein
MRLNQERVRDGYLGAVRASVIFDYSQRLQADVDIHWVLHSISEIALYHEGVLVKSCITLNDYFGYLKSFEGDDASQLCSRYAVTTESTLEVVTKVSIVAEPYFEDDACRKHNASIKDGEAMLLCRLDSFIKTPHRAPWFSDSKNKEKVDVYWLNFEPIKLLTEKTVWSSKNTPEQNDALFADVIAKYKDLNKWRDPILSLAGDLYGNKSPTNGCVVKVLAEPDLLGVVFTVGNKKMLMLENGDVLDCDQSQAIKPVGVANNFVGECVSSKLIDDVSKRGREAILEDFTSASAIVTIYGKHEPVTDEQCESEIKWPSLEQSIDLNSEVILTKADCALDYSGNVIFPEPIKEIELNSVSVVVIEGNFPFGNRKVMLTAKQWGFVLEFDLIADVIAEMIVLKQSPREYLSWLPNKKNQLRKWWHSL